MLYIDAREGLSGDMLLAAMIGLLEDDLKSVALEKMSNAARTVNLGFRFTEAQDHGETGWGVSYSGEGIASESKSYEQATSVMELYWSFVRIAA